jgi:hypothetical protein
MRHPTRPPNLLPPPGRARELALKAGRRAEALRANLHRRKDQSRARSTPEDAAQQVDDAPSKTDVTGDNR